MKKSLKFLCNLGKVNKNKQKMEIEERTVKTLAIEFLEKWDIKYEIQEYKSCEAIFFKYQGAGFFICFLEKAPTFFSIVMPFIHKIDNDRIKVLETIVNLMSERKLIRASLHNDDVILNIETFVDPNSNFDFFEEMIESCFMCLFENERKFRELLKE